MKLFQRLFKRKPLAIKQEQEEYLEFPHDEIPEIERHLKCLEESLNRWGLYSIESGIKEVGQYDLTQLKISIDDAEKLSLKLEFNSIVGESGPKLVTVRIEINKAKDVLFGNPWVEFQDDDNNEDEYSPEETFLLKHLTEMVEYIAKDGTTLYEEIIKEYYNRIALNRDKSINDLLKK